MKTAKCDPKRAKKHLEKLREIIAKDPPHLFKMSKSVTIQVKISEQIFAGYVM